MKIAFLAAFRMRIPAAAAAAGPATRAVLRLDAPVGQGATDEGRDASRQADRGDGSGRRRGAGVAPAVPALRPLHARARRLPAALGARSAGLCAMKRVLDGSPRTSGVSSRKSVSHRFAPGDRLAQKVAHRRAILRPLPGLMRSHYDLNPSRVLLVARFAPQSRPTQSA